MSTGGLILPAMKKLLPVIALLAAVSFGSFMGSRGGLESLIGSAEAGGPTVPTIYQREPHYWGGAHEFANGVTVSGPLAWTSTIDFATATTTCTESSAITVQGAAVNDSCFIGPPATGGSTNATYSCYVSAANAIKARHCAAGTADDPASATFEGFVIHN